MRWVPALLLTLPGCRDLTSVGADRLPPPEREVVEEGDLSNPRDPCGALAIAAPHRLTATAGDSEDVHLATVVEPGGQRFVAVVWLESPDPDEEEEAASGSVQAQLLLPDGSRFGDVLSLPVADPRAIDVASVTLEDTAGVVVVVADAGAPTVGALVTPAGASIHRLAELPPLSSPRVAALPDRVIVVGLEPDTEPGEAGGASLVELLPLERQGLVTNLGIQAREIAVATSGTEAWIGWLRDDSLYGSALEVDDDGFRLAAPLLYGAIAAESLRRGQGTADLTVTLGSGVQPGRSIELLRLDDRGWAVLSALALEEGTPVTGAAALGEAGGRWGILRPFLPAGGETTEMRLERLRPGFPPCSTPTECIRVTTDELPSDSGDVIALPEGWALAWSDDVGGQTDVFATIASCRDTEAAPDDGGPDPDER